MNEVDDYTTTEGKVENGNVTITNTHVPVIPEEPEDPKTIDVTFSKVEVNSQVHRSKLFQVKPQTVKSPQMQKRVKT